ncbi:MAG TPA: helix-turn-helix domain-containing protein [Bacteroidia bacterium]|nr:helix-turn-helix domain-containing protein [Bacteroidia bacterium]
MGISMRQLERTFKDHAGFSPKTYARILRFQSTTKEYGNTHKTLTDIALDCGYYDQAHFIHDFRQFSGYAPGDYFFGKPEGIEYRETLSCRIFTIPPLRACLSLRKLKHYECTQCSPRLPSGDALPHPPQCKGLHGLGHGRAWRD